MNEYKILNYGDLTPFTDIIDNKPLYYAGLDPVMKYKNLPCVFLATDLENPNTYYRYNIEWLNNRGFNILIKVKYTHTLYNKANPNGKQETHTTTGAPVKKPDYIRGGDNSIHLKAGKNIYFVEPENIIKFYNVKKEAAL